MKNLETDSALVEKLIARGREITRLFREAVTADRHSKKLSVGRSGKNIAWTNAAKDRDDKVKLLREILVCISRDL